MGIIHSRSIREIPYGYKFSRVFNFRVFCGVVRNPRNFYNFILILLLMYHLITPISSSPDVLVYMVASNHRIARKTRHLLRYSC